MPEVALHILDLVQNSIAAGATYVAVCIVHDTQGDRLTVEISDNGCGMSKEMAQRAHSPFATGRKSRRVGLGLALFSQLAEATDGEFSLASREGEGTVVRAEFRLSHPDLPPMGDLAGTVQALLVSAPKAVDFLLSYARDSRSFALDTREVRAALGGLPLNLPDVLSWVREYLSENIMEVDSL